MNNDEYNDFNRIVSMFERSHTTGLDRPLFRPRSQSDGTFFLIEDKSIEFLAVRSWVAALVIMVIIAILLPAEARWPLYLVIPLTLLVLYPRLADLAPSRRRAINLISESRCDSIDHVSSRRIEVQYTVDVASGSWYLCRHSPLTPISFEWRKAYGDSIALVFLTSSNVRVVAIWPEQDLSSAESEFNTIRKIGGNETVCKNLLRWTLTSDSASVTTVPSTPCKGQVSRSKIDIPSVRVTCLLPISLVIPLLILAPLVCGAVRWAQESWFGPNAVTIGWYAVPVIILGGLVALLCISFWILPISPGKSLVIRVWPWLIVDSTNVLCISLCSRIGSEGESIYQVVCNLISDRFSFSVSSSMSGSVELAESIGIMLDTDVLGVSRNADDTFD